MNRFLIIRRALRSAMPKIIAALEPKDRWRARLILNQHVNIEDMEDTLARVIESEPDGLAALELEATDPIPDRPFLDWLINQGGWDIIYEIARMILAAFGITMPPLP